MLPIESLPQPILCWHVRIRELGAEENNWLKVVQQAGSQAKGGLGPILPVFSFHLPLFTGSTQQGGQCSNYKAQQSLSNQLRARLVLPSPAGKGEKAERRQREGRQDRLVSLDPGATSVGKISRQSILSLAH